MLDGPGTRRGGTPGTRKGGEERAESRREREGTRAEGRGARKSQGSSGATRSSYPITATAIQSVAGCRRSALGAWGSGMPRRCTGTVLAVAQFVYLSSTGNAGPAVLAQALHGGESTPTTRIAHHTRRHPAPLSCCASATNSSNKSWEDLFDDRHGGARRCIVHRARLRLPGRRARRRRAPQWHLLAPGTQFLTPALCFLSSPAFPHFGLRAFATCSFMERPWWFRRQRAVARRSALRLRR